MNAVLVLKCAECGKKIELDELKSGVTIECRCGSKKFCTGPFDEEVN